jgi:signal transduction histidine kinase/HPt (histidine-containing phosphotransfer) domain-containing protein
MAAYSSRPAEDSAPAAGRLSWAGIVGLGLAGFLPPLALTMQPAGLGYFGAVPVNVALTALLILAPALVGLLTALAGPEKMRDNWRIGGGSERRRAAFRVFAGALAVAYGVAAAILAPSGEAIGALAVAALGLGGAWMLLLAAMFIPSPSLTLTRLGLTTVYDAALVSGLLHFGGELSAPWVLVYLPVAFDAGLRGGIGALAISAVSNLAGFAAVVATTPYWQEQLLLAGGLAAALAALPAYAGFMVVELAASREAVTAAQSARARFMTIVSGALRGPLAAIADLSKSEMSTAAPSARALLSQVNNILDFTAIEAGAFVPQTEAFDLHRLVIDTLADRREEARGKGLNLRCHIDPALPYRLRGWPQQLRQILDYFVARAIEVTPEGVVRVAIDAAGVDDRQVRVRLVVRDGGPAIGTGELNPLFDPFGVTDEAADGPGGFGLSVARRLVELMRGEIRAGGGEANGALTVMLPLALDEPPVDSGLDLEGTLLLIASEDSEFASDLAEPLNAWNADPRWIDSFDGTLDFQRRDPPGCSVLVVDGRHKKLAALSFAHRAAGGATAPSFIIFVTEAAQMAGLIELAGDEVDAVLAAPLDHRLFANALHALPLWRGSPVLPVVVPASHEPAAMTELPFIDPDPAPGLQVTPIAAHPRFAAETPIVDPRAVMALRRLGGDDAFLDEVLDSFRADAEEIMRRLMGAAAATDDAAFARGLHALRNCAANLGGTRLCEVLLSLRAVSAPELREQGSVLVERLGDELARLDAALAAVFPASEEWASG